MAKKEEPKITAEQPQVDPKVMIDGLVQKAKVALDEYMKLDQEQIDNITKAAALAGLSAQMELAKMAVEETGRGIFEDKVTKNIFSTEYIWHSIKYEVLHRLQTQHLQQCSRRSAVLRQEIRSSSVSTQMLRNVQ